MEEIKEIKMEKLKISDYNIRQKTGLIAELSKNIKKNGLDQPLIVRPDGNSYEIVSGQRRYKAYQALGKTKIPCIIKEMENRDAMLHSLSENIFRDNITADEKARAYAILTGKKLDDNNLSCKISETFSQKELAEKLGVSQQNISKSLEPLRQAEKTRELVNKQKLSEEIAREIRRFTNTDEQEKGLAEAFANSEKGQDESLKMIQKARENSTPAEELKQELQGKIDDKDLGEDIEDLTNEDEEEDVTSEDIGEDDLDLDVADVDMVKEGLNIEITKEELVNKVKKHSEENDLSIKEIVETALEEYLKDKQEEE